MYRDKVLKRRIASIIFLSLVLIIIINAYRNIRDSRADETTYTQERILYFDALLKNSLSEEALNKKISVTDNLDGTYSLYLPGKLYGTKVEKYYLTNGQVVENDSDKNLILATIPQELVQGSNVEISYELLEDKEKITDEQENDEDGKIEVVEKNDEIDFTESLVDARSKNWKVSKIKQNIENEKIELFIEKNDEPVVEKIDESEENDEEKDTSSNENKLTNTISNTVSGISNEIQNSVNETENKVSDDSNEIQNIVNEIANSVSENSNEILNSANQITNIASKSTNEIQNKATTTVKSTTDTTKNKKNTAEDDEVKKIENIKAIYNNENEVNEENLQIIEEENGVTRIRISGISVKDANKLVIKVNDEEEIVVFNMIKKSEKDEKTFLGTSIEKTKIQKVLFLDKNEETEIPEETEDISAEQDNSIKAWIDEDGILKIISDGCINSNYNSSYMFAGINGEIEGLENLKTFTTVNMDYMFKGIIQEKLKLTESFDTSNVRTMRGMFKETRIDELDLSNTFNTEKVSDMSTMFENSEISKINLGRVFYAENVQNASKMFENIAGEHRIKANYKIFESSNLLQIGENKIEFNEDCLECSYGIYWEIEEVETEENKIDLEEQEQTTSRDKKILYKAIPASEDSEEIKGELKPENITVYVEGKENELITKNVEINSDGEYIIELTNLESKNCSGNVYFEIEENVLQNEKGEKSVRAKTETKFIDFEKPQISVDDATIEKSKLKVTFSATDKYFKQSTVNADEITVLIDGNYVDEEKVKKTISGERISEEIEGESKIVGAKYVLTIEEKEKNAFDNAENILLAFNSGIAEDETGNVNVASSASTPLIVIGKDDEEPEGQELVGMSGTCPGGGTYYCEHGYFSSHYYTDTCSVCDGDGWTSREICTYCDGLTIVDCPDCGYGTILKECSNCGGTGSVDCSRCNGEGFVGICSLCSGQMVEYIECCPTCSACNGQGTCTGNGTFVRNVMDSMYCATHGHTAMCSADLYHCDICGQDGYFNCVWLCGAPTSSPRNITYGMSTM